LRIVGTNLLTMKV